MRVIASHPFGHPRVASKAVPRAGLGSLGQSLVEFTLVVPVLMVLLLALADFGRVYATGIAIESAARDAAEIAAQRYLSHPPGPLSAPAPSPGDPAYYGALHQIASSTVCAEMQSFPNSGFAGATCAGIPVQVCVHDGADPSCASEPDGIAIPASCSSMATPPSTAQAGGAEASRYVEVRVCYRFSTLLNIPNIAGIAVPFGDFYLERARVFTVADY